MLSSNGGGGFMKKVLTALIVMLIASSPAFAIKPVDDKKFECPANWRDKPGVWAALGFATKQNDLKGYYETEYVRIDFKNCEACVKLTDDIAMSNESIGTGGTNGRVDGFEWNYDATCFYIE